VPTLLLIRHGQASFGSGDYDVLSELGIRQAEIVAAALQDRGVQPTRLISGAFRRQVDTAAAYASRLGTEVEIDARWNEYDGNEVLLHHSESTARIDGWPADGIGLSNREFQVALDGAIGAWIDEAERSPAAQSWPAFAASGSGALQELTGELGRGETAVVFTSGGVIAAICAQLVGEPDRAFVPFNRTQINTGITKIVHGGSGTSLVSVNDHSHLESVDPALVTYR
jgi:broad specificity phosphatase PhoE